MLMSDAAGLSTRFVTAGGVEWYLQDLGAGPVVILVHGTGSSSHSWRDVAPRLAAHFRVIVPDLPGHGFSSALDCVSLPGMAAALSELLRVMAVEPVVVAGHSAGAAVLVRAVLDQLVAPQMIVSINGALLPFSGYPRWLFAPLARFLARSSIVPRWAAYRARDSRVIEKLVRQTGSRLDANGIRLYQQLVQRPEHIAAALAMMASWDLESLARDLPQLRIPLHLLSASGDLTVPASQAQRVRAFTGCARVTSLGPLGHLAHEEQPVMVADQLIRLATEAGVLR